MENEGFQYMMSRRATLEEHMVSPLGCGYDSVRGHTTAFMLELLPLSCFRVLELSYDNKHSHGLLDIRQVPVVSTKFLNTS